MEKYNEEKFLKYIITELVDKKDQIKISRQIDELGVLLTLSVAEEDLPRIIGKEGNTIKAIRSLLRVLGYIQKMKVNLKMDIPEEIKIKK